MWKIGRVEEFAADRREVAAETGVGHERFVTPGMLALLKLGHDRSMPTILRSALGAWSERPRAATVTAAEGGQGDVLLHP